MKQTLVILFFVAFTQLFTCCNKTNDGIYTEPISIYEKIGGTWELTKLNLVDEVAAANSLKPDAINLTTKFDFRSFKMTLLLDESFNPTTFEVTGNAPGLFIKNGYWDLSHPFPNTDTTPVKLRLYSNEAKTELADVLNITSLPGQRSVMDFSLTRSVNDVPYATYQYGLKQ